MMATEHLPEMPDLRSLRLAYTSAIAATDATKALADKPGVRFIERMERRAHYHACRDTELQAGRAFLAALQEEDPACTQCGCTQFDPCEQEDGPCEWASADPPICSACTGQRPAWVTVEATG